MASEDDAERCRRNLAAVRDRVDTACRQAGRPAGDVRIIGVTKYVSDTRARLLLDAGCGDLGESRPQALWEKAAELGGHVPPPRWHLIGHLQRNKVRRTLPLVTLVHSLDSPRLLAAIEAEAAAIGRTCDVLVEVNLAGDPARSGVRPDDVEPLIVAAFPLTHVRVVGLMGMASVPQGDGGAAARRQFAALRTLRDRLSSRMPVGAEFRELSMGMSGDYVEAILEGATMVRIGSALWGGMAE